MPKPQNAGESGRGLTAELTPLYQRAVTYDRAASSVPVTQANAELAHSTYLTLALSDCIASSLRVCGTLMTDRAAAS
jgi:hypothetical protein